MGRTSPTIEVKRIVFILLFLATLPALGQQKYALLIGIGQYPESSGWSVIHGDNDVSIVKTRLLKEGFNEDNISVLMNSSATKGSIMSALEELRRRADQGDVVYIHFSGHGQQVTDLDGDESDHYDEAWIPYNARKKYEAGIYEGENHILDDELNLYLNGLRSKVGARGKIVLVADACHSGSGSRGLSDDEDEFVRGTNDKFEIPGGGSNVIKKEAPVYWLYVGACKPYQNNYEHKATDGTYYGSLSYVIANGKTDLVTSDYRDVINIWKAALVEITRYPQDLDDEGRPSRRSNMLF